MQCYDWLKFHWKANMHWKWALIASEFYCQLFPHALYLINESSIKPCLTRSVKTARIRSVSVEFVFIWYLYLIFLLALVPENIMIWCSLWKLLILFMNSYIAECMENDHTGLLFCQVWFQEKKNPHKTLAFRSFDFSQTFLITGNYLLWGNALLSLQWSV